MSSTFKMINVGQAVAMATSLCLSIAFLVAIYAFRKVSDSNLFDMTPAFVLLAVAIPAAIFGIVFVQIRDAKANMQATVEHERSNELTMPKAARRASSTEIGTTSKMPELFENL